jgi:hypothetical protein
MSEARSESADRVNILASLPQRLVESLQAEADREARSRNAQLLYILQERYGPDAEAVAAVAKDKARRRKTA